MVIVGDTIKHQAQTTVMAVSKQSFFYTELEFSVVYSILNKVFSSLSYEFLQCEKNWSKNAYNYPYILFSLFLPNILFPDFQWRWGEHCKAWTREAVWHRQSPALPGDGMQQKQSWIFSMLFGSSAMCEQISLPHVLLLSPLETAQNENESTACELSCPWARSEGKPCVRAAVGWAWLAEGRGGRGLASESLRSLGHAGFFSSPAAAHVQTHTTPRQAFLGRGGPWQFREDNGQAPRDRTDPLTAEPAGRAAAIAVWGWPPLPSGGLELLPPSYHLQDTAVRWHVVLRCSHLASDFQWWSKWIYMTLWCSRQGIYWARRNWVLSQELITLVVKVAETSYWGKKIHQKICSYLVVFSSLSLLQCPKFYSWLSSLCYLFKVRMFSERETILNH